MKFSGLLFVNATIDAVHWSGNDDISELWRVYIVVLYIVVHACVAIVTYKRNNVMHACLLSLFPYPRTACQVASRPRGNRLPLYSQQSPFSRYRTCRCSSWKLTFDAKRCPLSSVASLSHWASTLFVCCTFAVMQRVVRICQRQLILVVDMIFSLVSDIAVFVLKRDVKLQLTNWYFHKGEPCSENFTGKIGSWKKTKLFICYLFGQRLSRAWV